MDNKKNAKNADKFICEFCYFKCSKNSDWERHINTSKHKNRKNDNKNQCNDNDFTPKNAEFKCECGSVYSYSSGLSRHKKKCNGIKHQPKTVSNDIAPNCVITPELIIELIKNNSEMQQTIMNLNNTIQGLVSNGVTNANHSNINSNNNNKSFNLQFFLNETCKNAMNIMDFANSIQVSLSDLEKVGELGYVEGISKIIIDNLKLLDITQIPVHCSDFKRDVLYVKDENKWEKENEDKPKIKKLINSVTNKNISLISEWKHKNPECTNSHSNKSTQVNKIIMEIMNTDKEKREKIVKKIAQETTIDKEPTCPSPIEQ